MLSGARQETLALLSGARIMASTPPIGCSLSCLDTGAEGHPKGDRPQFSGSQFPVEAPLVTPGSLDLLLMTGEVTNIPGPQVANDKRATGHARSGQ